MKLKQDNTFFFWVQYLPKTFFTQGTNFTTCANKCSIAVTEAELEVMYQTNTYLQRQSVRPAQTTTILSLYFIATLLISHAFINVLSLLQPYFTLHHAHFPPFLLPSPYTHLIHPAISTFISFPPQSNILHICIDSTEKQHRNESIDYLSRIVAGLEINGNGKLSCSLWIHWRHWCKANKTAWCTLGEPSQITVQRVFVRLHSGHTLTTRNSVFVLHTAWAEILYPL